MKSIIVSLFILLYLSFCISAGAQNNDYRDKGLKGSIALSSVSRFDNERDSYALGAELTLGYMFNRQHFLGVNAEVSHPLPWKNQAKSYWGTLYFNYQFYFFEKAASPLVGIKTGFFTPFHDFFHKMLTRYYVEPYLGWSWGLSSHLGMTIRAGVITGAKQWVLVNGGSSYKTTPLIPKVSIALDF